MYGDFMNKTAIKLIEWYQKDISPNSNHKCRHTPTCSAYAKTAYERFNFFKASFLTTKRVLTCNPLFKPKYDPVPEKKTKKQPKKDKDDM
jgi:putative membrane protein insertion efficiency factor